MAADSRYLYHHSPHQTLATPQYNYQYQNPPVPYNETSVPRRTQQQQQQQASPHPHSPVQYHHSQPPPPPPPAQPGAYSSYSYQPAPPTATPPPQQQQQQQWSSVNETWPPQYGYPPSISPESTYNNRPEASTAGYEPHQPPPPPNPMNGTTTTTKYRHRLPEELESPPSYTNSQPSSPNSYAHTAIDFDQLMKHIKFVETPFRETLSGPNSSYKSPFPGPEALEQMMNAATYAAQMLESAAGTTSFSTTTMSTSPSPMDSVSYTQSSNSTSMDTSHHHHHQGGAGYPSPPTSREAGTQSPHHSIDNSSPPLSASVKRLHSRMP
ncbi:hypothetical protein BDP27DRAFT_234513 [Rhodocollybia butyracea]|uniref:Uncharacterized protein n=1 Tax=Rhodocollybia butyracea TaxID=206335 RepID=A0A9P5U1E2_9AGAR|nr:hypothetical protein BDP27DRAFT_234513 [Rhodocollybia butyracea]